MKIAKNTVVTVEYALSDAQNNVLEEHGEPIVYLHGGYENTLPAIEASLEGKEPGFSVMIQVEPEEAFGEYDPELVRMEDRSKLPTPLEVGMQFEGIPDQTDDDDDPVIFVVTDIAEDKVVLDGNHPLAGVALRFALNVTGVRLATEEEIADQHPHFDDQDEAGGDQYRSYPIQ